MLHGADEVKGDEIAGMSTMDGVIGAWAAN